MPLLLECKDLISSCLKISKLFQKIRPDSGNGMEFDPQSVDGGHISSFIPSFMQAWWQKYRFTKISLSLSSSEYIEWRNVYITSLQERNIWSDGYTWMWLNAPCWMCNGCE